MPRFENSDATISPPAADSAARPRFELARLRAADRIHGALSPRPRTA